MRLLVTGAAGMLGRDVVAAARARGHDVLPLTRGDLDLTDAEGVRATIAEAAPRAVVNCAAWTDVDGAEADEAAATAVNGRGAGNVAAAAAAVGARVVHVSTDYVFDGTKREPYVESDPVAPRSAYGRSKLAGERAVAGDCPDHAIVRTAWVFGLHGGNFVATMLRLAADRDAVRVVTDQVGSPTWTGHLAPALVEVAESDVRGVLHVAGGGSCSWRELAIEAFRRAGVDCVVEATTTAEFPRPAERPAYSVLRSERPGTPALPAWPEGLAGYLDQRVSQEAHA